ncbi:hypothetical protein, partial [Nitrospira sp. BLG_2]|uniref:hypothetical protein n=1 Tax=Nitrospira sp. BLG_2 TaxID=3397507 RepID=UPI003B9A0A91
AASSAPSIRLPVHDFLFPGSTVVRVWWMPSSGPDRIHASPAQHRITAERFSAGIGQIVIGAFNRADDYYSCLRLGTAHIHSITDAQSIFGE